MSELSQREAIEIIQDTINRIPEFVAYYSLRSYKVPRVRKASMRIVRACIALEFLGLHITTNLLEFVLGDKNKLYTILHRLGDYNVLDNIETDNHTLVYTLNEDFKTHIKLPEL